MTTPFLSVVIPTFNGAEYIGACLDSALSDCPDDVEFIVVDDGSTDGTASVVCSIISRMQGGPSVILRKNTAKGVTSARKYGVELSSGQYVTFLDSDDFVERGAYRRLSEEAKRTKADVICFGSDEIDRETIRRCFFRSFSSDHGQRVRDCIALKTSPYVCTKLIRKELLCGIVFPPGNMAEDWAVCVQLFLGSDNISFVDDVLYHYRMLDSSLTHSISTKEESLYKMTEEKKNVDFICGILDTLSLSDKYRKEIVCRKTNVKRFMFPYLKKREDYDLWRSIFPEINSAALYNPLVRVEYRIKHILSLMGVLHLVYPLLSFKRKIFSKCRCAIFPS